MKYSWILLLFPLFACAMQKANSAPGGLPAEYFPLKTGLFWKYQYTGMPRNPQIVEIRIKESKQINGKTYFLFSTWFTLTRNDPVSEMWIAWENGIIYAWDGSAENVLIGPAVADAKIAEGKEPVTVSAGTYANTYTYQDGIGYADAGTMYVFARNTGMVSVGMIAIWGPANYELLETNANQSGS
jgi:hypothetical protein